MKHVCENERLVEAKRAFCIASNNFRKLQIAAPSKRNALVQASEELPWEAFLRPPLGFPAEGRGKKRAMAGKRGFRCVRFAKKFLGAIELFKIRFAFVLHTSIDACIAVGVVLLLVLVLLSLLIAKSESLLVLQLSLAWTLQLILILVLVVAPVRVSILVLRPIPLLESKSILVRYRQLYRHY